MAQVQTDTGSLYGSEALGLNATMRLQLVQAALNRKRCIKQGYLPTPSVNFVLHPITGLHFALDHRRWPSKMDVPLYPLARRLLSEGAVAVLIWENDISFLQDLHHGSSNLWAPRGSRDAVYKFKDHGPPRRP